MSIPPAILEVEGIGKRFGDRQVLKAASFWSYPGRITALMGRNGAGKSTLLRVAVGRLRADWGRVAYKGAFLHRPSLARLARNGLMYAPQDTFLAPPFPLRKHLDAVAGAFGVEDRVQGVLEGFHLGAVQDQPSATLSGGERRRAALALAMIRRPDCLLMDEPFSGIAPRDRELVARGLSSLRDDGTAVVISGHEVEELFQVGDGILWVTAGTTHWLGSPEHARGHDQFRREYLGPRGEKADAP